MSLENLYAFINCDMQSDDTTFGGTEEEKYSDEILFLKKLVAKYKPLTVKQEHTLFVNHDYDTVVMHYLRYVYGQVKSMLGESCPYFVDAFNECVIALKVAAKKFDLDRGVRFIAYVPMYVRAAILECRRQYSSKLEVTQWKSACVVMKMNEKFRNQYGYDPTSGDLAQFMWDKGVRLDKSDEEDLADYIREVLCLSQSTESTDKSIGNDDSDEGCTTFGDQLSDYRKADAALCENDGFLHMLAIVKQVLTEKEADIFLSANGIGVPYPTSTRSLSEKYGLCEVRINGILREVKKKLMPYFLGTRY